MNDEEAEGAWLLEPKLDEEAIRWGSQFGLASLIDFDFVVGAKFGIPVGLKNSHPSSLKRSVLAAVLSHQMGLSSIDYARKRYVGPDKCPESAGTLGEEISRFASEQIQTSRREFLKFTERNVVRIGDQIADMNIMRLSSTLLAALAIANKGMLFETQCLVRFALEQIAWSHACEKLDNEDAIIELEATNCIGGYKSVYPTIGRLYGHLSNIAHWNPEFHYLFITQHKGKGASTLTSARFKAIALCYVLLGIDMYHSLIESIYSDKKMSFRVFADTKQFDATRKTKGLVERVLKSFDDYEVAEALTFFP